MKIFLDTSSLFKLYHQEKGTQELERLFELHKITHVYLSELSKIEFSSTIWKKVRTRELTFEQAKISISLFENDFERYNFITLNTIVIEKAKKLLSKYGSEGLRSLDSIQLSTCVLIAGKVDIFITSDNLLKEILQKEGLKTDE